MMKKILITVTIVALVLSIPNSYAAEKFKPLPEINVLTYTPEQFLTDHEMANYIAEQWRKLGLRVKVKPEVFPNPMVEIWFKTRTFDCIMASYGDHPARLEPDFFTNAKFHSSYSVPGGWNTGEYKNPDFDKIGEEQLKIYDPEKRRALIYKLQEILYNDQPLTVVLFAIDNYGMNVSRVELDYVPASGALKSIWNYPRVNPKGTDRVVKFGLTEDLRTWNPVAAFQENDFRFLQLVYDRLVQVAPDGSVSMWAAKSVNAVDDTTIDVILKEGLKFSDGTPLTVEDVKFTYEYLKKWEAPYYKKYLEPIKEVKIVDKNKVRFYLSRPFSPFIMNTLGQVFIIPGHIWKDIPQKFGLAKPQDYRNIPPIGSGMYKLDYWREGQEFRLLRNPEHFMAPKADALNIVFGSAELQTAALKMGTIDVATVKIMPAVAKELEKEKNIKLFKTTGVGYHMVEYHCGRPPFSDKTLREALSYAVPYEKIINEVFLGDAKRSASTISPDNAFWHNKNLKLKDFDLEKARRILKGAGYLWDEQGRLCYPAK